MRSMIQCMQVASTYGFPRLADFERRGLTDSNKWPPRKNISQHAYAPKFGQTGFGRILENLGEVVNYKFKGPAGGFRDFAGG